MTASIGTVGAMAQTADPVLTTLSVDETTHGTGAFEGAYGTDGYILPAYYGDNSSGMTAYDALPDYVDEITYSYEARHGTWLKPERRQNPCLQLEKTSLAWAMCSTMNA